MNLLLVNLNLYSSYNNVYETYLSHQFSKITVYSLPRNTTRKVQYFHALTKKRKRTVQTTRRSTHSALSSHPTITKQNTNELTLSTLDYGELVSARKEV